MTGLDAVSVPVVEYVGVLLADAATPTVRLAVRVGVPDAPDDALAVELMDTDAPRVRLPERVLVLEKLIVSDGVEVALVVGGKDSDAETPCVFDAVAAVLLVAEAATERDTVTAALVDADAPNDTDAVAFGVVAAVSDAVAAAEGDTVTAAVVDADEPRPVGGDRANQRRHGQLGQPGALTTGEVVGLTGCGGHAAQGAGA